MSHGCKRFSKCDFCHVLDFCHPHEKVFLLAKPPGFCTPSIRFLLQKPWFANQPLSKPPIVLPSRTCQTWQNPHGQSTETAEKQASNLQLTLKTTVQNLERIERGGTRIGRIDADQNNLRRDYFLPLKNPRTSAKSALSAFYSLNINSTCTNILPLRAANCSNYFWPPLS